MLDVRIPMGILFVVLGALLYFYGMFFSEAVPFYTPNSWFPLKLDQPVGAFMFMFGVIMLVLARFIRIHTADRELAAREKELGRVERKRQKALDKRLSAAREAGDAEVSESDDAEVSEPGDTADGEGQADAGVHGAIESKSDSDASAPEDEVSGETNSSGESEASGGSETSGDSEKSK